MVCKKLRALMIIMLLLTVTAFASTTGKIRGRVVDEASGEPLAGATVMIEGTSLGAFTQADGNYFIYLSIFFVYKDYSFGKKNLISFFVAHGYNILSSNQIFIFDGGFTTINNSCFIIKLD